MMKTFAPEDNNMDDNEYHKLVRSQALLYVNSIVNKPNKQACNITVVMGHDVNK